MATGQLVDKGGEALHRRTAVTARVQTLDINELFVFETEQIWQMFEREK